MISKIGDPIGNGYTVYYEESQTAMFMDGRSIGGIIPDVIIEEVHTDTLTITDHPVELGAAITDHAFKNPSEIVMVVAWSNSKALDQAVVPGTMFQGQIQDANELYRQLLRLQEEREPFDVVTGKRTYSDMLIKQLSVTTDANSENCVIVTVVMRQIIIVQTYSVKIPPAKQQSQPQTTAGVQDAGTKQPVKAQNQSGLSTLLGG